MFVLVHISGVGRMVRQRYGETMDSPMSETEEGMIESEPLLFRSDQEIAHMVQDLRYRQNTRAPWERARVRLAAEAWAVASPAPPTEAGTDGDGEEPLLDPREDRRSPAERLGAPDAESLVERALRNPRRFLRRVYHESIDQRVELAIVRPLASGIARLDLAAEQGHLTIECSVQLTGESEHPLSHVAVKAQSTRGAFSRLTLQISGKLLWDGTWEQLELKGFTKSLPRIGREQEALVGRLVRSVERAAAQTDPRDDRQRRLSRILELSLKNRIDLNFMVLLELIRGFSSLEFAFEEDQRTRQRVSQGTDRGLTLAEIPNLEGEQEEPPTDEIDLDDPGHRPAITWGPHGEFILQKGPPEGPASLRAQEEFERLVVFVPIGLRLASRTQTNRPNPTKAPDA